MRYAIETIPPILMAGGRFVLAGSALFTWFLWRHRPTLTWQDWRTALIAGLLLVVGGFGLSAWGQQFVPSGLTSLLVATTPIWIVILEWIEGHGNRPNTLTLAGVAIGLAGVGFLSGGSRDILMDSGDTAGAATFGVLAVRLAALSWAGGSIYFRNRKSSVPLLLRSGMLMLTGGIVLVITGLAVGEASQLSPDSISMRSILSFIYLVLFGSLLAHSAYVWLLNVSTPTRVSTHAFFNPLVAVLLGWMFANEQVTSEMSLGATAILISLFLVIQPRLRRRSLAANLR